MQIKKYCQGKISGHLVEVEALKLLKKSLIFFFNLISVLGKKDKQLH